MLNKWSNDTTPWRFSWAASACIGWASGEDTADCLAGEGARAGRTARVRTRLPSNALRRCKLRLPCPFSHAAIRFRAFSAFLTVGLLLGMRCGLFCGAKRDEGVTQG